MFIIIGMLTEKMFFTGGAGYIGSPCVVELMELAIWLFLVRRLGRLAASGSDSIQLR
jgi:UDP-glucose 4-epimerase